MGFMGGFVGARFGGNNKVIIQKVERSDSSSADSESAAEGTTVSSGMTTAQVAKTVSPSVVVITTEQVVYPSGPGTARARWRAAPAAALSSARMAISSPVTMS